jgi:hypothetical protein
VPTLAPPDTRLLVATPNRRNYIGLAAQPNYQLSTADFCPWCQQCDDHHDDEVGHLLDVCLAWNELWDWIRSTLCRACTNAHDDTDDGDTTHHRGDFLLFGHCFACTTPVEYKIQGAV